MEKIEFDLSYQGRDAVLHLYKRELDEKHIEFGATVTFKDEDETDPILQTVIPKEEIMFVALRMLWILAVDSQETTHHE
jgi:hypothetical protein